jgi:hypothetical protein
VFVFGSNPQGIHGAGAAKVATTKYYATLGKGRGHMGQSYGLVTKNLTPNYHEEESGITYKIAGERSVSIKQIVLNIIELYLYAIEHPELDFLIAYTLAPNLNGYTSGEMAAMFSLPPIPNNIIFNDEFSKLLKL